MTTKDTQDMPGALDPASPGNQKQQTPYSTTEHGAEIDETFTLLKDVVQSTPAATHRSREEDQYPPEEEGEELEYLYSCRTPKREDSEPDADIFLADKISKGLERIEDIENAAMEAFQHFGKEKDMICHLITRMTNNRQSDSPERRRSSSRNKGHGMLDNTSATPPHDAHADFADTVTAMKADVNVSAAVETLDGPQHDDETDVQYEHHLEAVRRLLRHSNEVDRVFQEQ